MDVLQICSSCRDACYAVEECMIVMSILAQFPNIFCMTPLLSSSFSPKVKRSISRWADLRSQSQLKEKGRVKERFAQILPYLHCVQRKKVHFS